MERPPKKYVCEKCGYFGDTSEHEGCNYLAWTTCEQLYIDQLEAELTSLRASPASVPEGYAIVPVGPTQEMLDAGCKALGALYGQYGASEAYRSMIAAAPTPPVSEDRKDAERLNYLQEHGATVHLVPTTNSNLWSFVIGGLYRSKRLNLREAIDAAMKEDKP